VTKGMNDFMNLYVTKYSKYQSVKTHFTGSIAYYFSDILNETAAKKDIEVGKIIKEPINDLVQYHVNKRYK
jgi:glucosamine kinase